MKQKATWRRYFAALPIELNLTKASAKTEMPKFPTARPTYSLDQNLLEAVKTVLRSRRKGVQSPAFSSTGLEAQLKQQGVSVQRGADLKTVLDHLRRAGLITLDSRRAIGNWYIEVIDPSI